jgi:hypothetical protein
MATQLRYFWFGLMVSALVLTACTTAAQADAELARMRQAAENAGWSKHITLEFIGDKMYVGTTTIPDQGLLAQYQAVSIVDNVSTYLVSPTEQQMRLEIPLRPKLAAVKTSTYIGVIGVAINGALFYSPYEADLKTLALQDQSVANGIPFLDGCNGHPNPFAIQYHYHGIPYCLTELLDKEEEHSRLIGYLFDGFPVYGPRDVGGDFITPTQLDECNGHFGPTPEFPDGIYHYHTTAEPPYIMACYAGEVTLLPQTIRPVMQGVVWQQYWLPIGVALLGIVLLIAGVMLLMRRMSPPRSTAVV